jgi:hypothetical protein
MLLSAAIAAGFLCGLTFTAILAQAMFGRGNTRDGGTR